MKIFDSVKIKKCWRTKMEKMEKLDENFLFCED